MLSGGGGCLEKAVVHVGHAIPTAGIERRADHDFILGHARGGKIFHAGLHAAVQAVARGGKQVGVVPSLPLEAERRS